MCKNQSDIMLTSNKRILNIFIIIKLCDIYYVECLHFNNNYNNNISNNSNVKHIPPPHIPPSTSPTNHNNYADNDIKNLQRIIMEGLNLTYLPDYRKANISPREYYEKYNLYLTKVRERSERDRISRGRDKGGGEGDNSATDYIIPKTFDEDELYQKTFLTLLPIDHNNQWPMKNLTAGHDISKQNPIYRRNVQMYYDKYLRKKRSTGNSNNNLNDLIYVRFNLPDIKLNESQSIGEIIEESTLRLMISKNNHSINYRKNFNDDTSSSTLNIKVYQLIEPYERIWLDTYHLDLNSFDLHNAYKWIEFDVSKAIASWLGHNKKQNLGFEVLCEHCARYNLHIVHDTSAVNSYLNTDNSPVLNIISNIMHREKRSKNHHQQQQQHSMMQISKRKPRRTDCHKDNRKCCRHIMEVIFKEIKGFEFIIQPKIFDAGYCRGKCPARYNPAHHHALLQSLIWKQNKNKAPRPCCAPSKLVELEVLHVDEEDNTKLKVSTWSDMRVLECACS